VQVQLVSPEQVLYEGEAKMVVVRTLSGGDIAFEDNHAPFLGALTAWPARVKFEDGTQRWFAVHGGFVEVLDNQVRVLADVAEPGPEIDVQRARRALERSEPEMVNPSEGADPAQALYAVLRAEARIEAARKARANEE